MRLTRWFSGWVQLAMVAATAAAVVLPARASDVGDALRALSDMPRVKRQIRLADIGFSQPVVLEGSDVRQEFFWPVPRDARLHNARIDIRGNYAKAADTDTRLAFSLNGSPRDTRRLHDEGGPLSSVLALGPEEREGRFVRLGVAWQTLDDIGICSPEGVIGQGLTLSEDTTLSYELDYAEIGTLADAYAALPQEPRILLAGAAVDEASFDTAWRVGAALERDGRRPRVRALPAAGDTLDVSALVVPDALRGVSAFDGLDDASPTLRDDSQLAALMLLGWSGAQADVLVWDDAMRTRIGKAFDALEEQFTDDEDARDAVQSVRARYVPDLFDDGNSGLALHPFGGRPAIAMAPGAGAGFAGMLARPWQSMLGSGGLSVRSARIPGLKHPSGVPLPGLDGRAGAVDVRSKAAWTTQMPLASLMTEDGIPSALSLDVAAAPGASATRPVVSVFWNDVLLGARQLRARGESERLDMRIPAYALGADNILRVQFQRQPVHGGCIETPQAYPASVLPTSTIHLKAARSHASFVGILPDVAGGADLLVPQDWLGAAPPSLERLIRVAGASGLSLTETRLRPVSSDEAHTPGRAFVAVDVPLDGVQPKVALDKDGSVLIRDEDQTWLDLDHGRLAAAVEVVARGDRFGLLWQTLGADTAWPQRPFVLNRGDIALIDSQGPVAWIDSRRPSSTRTLLPGESAFFEWRHAASWSVLLTSAAVAAMLLLLWLAHRARRRRQNKS